MKFRHGWAGGRCCACCSAIRPHLAARDRARHLVAQRQRRRAAERVDPRLGRAPAAARSPLQLFQANIFYPAHDTLAFSEPLIVPALLGAPVAWLGGSPVLVFNLLVHRGLRADGVRRLRADRRVDRRPDGRAARRIDLRVQHAHADAPRARPGAAPLRAAAGAAGRRSACSSGPRRAGRRWLARAAG